MAVENRKSVQITNRDATPRVVNDGRRAQGSLRSSSDFVTVGSADSIASTFRILSIPTTAMVRAVLVSNGAITSAAADVGVYYPTGLDGTAGAVIDADFFGSAVSVATAQTNVDVTGESAVFTIAKRHQPLWQAVGLTSNPGGFLDIVVTLTAAATASADLMLEAVYLDNGS